MNKNWAKYVMGNFFKLTLLLFIVSIVSFMLIEASPIDPVKSYTDELVSYQQREDIIEHLGLDKPAPERYCSWLGNLLQGDLGDSLIYKKPVIDVISEKFASSMALMLTAWVLSGVIGFSLGIIMGIYHNTFIDSLLKKWCLLLASTPTFWVGLLFLMFFSVKLGWFPIGFSVPVGTLADQVTIYEKIHHMILPALALSFSSFAGIALHTREKMISSLNSDYVLFAKARGFSKHKIVTRHCIRNITLPSITLQFASLSEIFGGSILAETVFSYPGLGKTVVDAGLKGDVPLLLGITLFSTIFVFAGNFIANIIYGFVDPRIRLGGKNE